MLLDFGSHVIDVICWWLGAKPDVVQAETDGFGGPEAFVSAALVSGDTKIDVKLSYLTKLRNETSLKESPVVFGARRSINVDFILSRQADRSGPSNSMARKTRAR